MVPASGTASAEGDSRPLLPRQYGSGAAASPKAQQLRLVSLDQFRGLTMLSMLVVNFTGGLDCVPPALKHSYGRAPGGLGAADFVMPCFLFCVGFALQVRRPRRR